MVVIAELTQVIASRQANELKALADTPSAHAMVSILAERTFLKVEKETYGTDIDMFVCRDRELHAVRIPSPFAIAVVASHPHIDDLRLIRQLDAFLQENQLNSKPVLILSSAGLAQIGHGDFWASLKTTNIKVFGIELTDLLNILLHRPARDALISRVIHATSLKTVNPYQYKGPVQRSMFFGREEQLERLTKLSESYALVGPRRIGKSSLINRAYETVRELGNFAVRLESNSTIRDNEIFEQLVSRLVDDYQVRPNVFLRLGPESIIRVIEKVARQSPNKMLAIFVDEADTIESRCPRFVEVVRRLHDQGDARFVFAGFKELRKSINDSRVSPLMNVLTPLPIKEMELRESGRLVLSPMSELGIQFSNLPAIQEKVHLMSGGGPSRVQMYCRAMIEILADSARGTLQLADCEAAARKDWIQQEIVNWYSESTTDLEKIVAALAAFHLPSSIEDFVSFAEPILQLVPAKMIIKEVHDLMSAHVLTTQTNGQVRFGFPALVDLVKPEQDLRKSIHTLRHRLRQLANQPGIAIRGD